METYVRLENILARDKNEIVEKIKELSIKNEMLKKIIIECSKEIEMNNSELYLLHLNNKGE